MPWSCHCHGDPPVVESEYHGRMSTPELREMVTETLRLGAEAGARHFLGDCSELEPNDSIVDVFEMVQLLDSILTNRAIREALIVPRHPVTAEQVRFYETACRNRGVAVRVFEARDEARRWLLGHDA